MIGHLAIGTIIFLSIFNPLRAQTPIFQARWLPIIGNLTAINASVIQLVWRSASDLSGFNLAEQTGVFAVLMSTSYQMPSPSSLTVYELDRLNSSDTLTLSGFKPDTIYNVCFKSRWFPPNITIDMSAPYGTQISICKLVRTYATGKQTVKVQKH